MNALRAALVSTLVSATAFAQDPAAGEEFPREWFFHDDAQWQEHLPLLGQPMPTLDLSEWHNGEVDLDSLRGKVVVIDFWATWCGPCIAAIPHNNELTYKYGDQGMVLIGVCGSGSGQESMVSTADGNGVLYPVARDASQLSAEAWKVMWWPTYGVVDRAGNLRALGLKPGNVDAVVEKLLEEEGPAVEREVELPPVPEEWKEARTTGRGAVDALVGRKAPELGEGRAVNGALPEGGLSALEGKIVLVHFFSTWNEASRRATQRNRDLLTRYGDEDFVVVGVCAKRGADGLDRFLAETGADYLALVDEEGASAEAFRANSYPDDYLIDRQGRIRFADIRSPNVEDALRVLIDED
ncbi:MAG: redoxin domain-containing protein [Planctomycetota bacterium]